MSGSIRRASPSDDEQDTGESNLDSHLRIPGCPDIPYSYDNYRPSSTQQQQIGKHRGYQVQVPWQPKHESPRSHPITLLSLHETLGTPNFTTGEQHFLRWKMQSGVDCTETTPDI